MTAILDTLEDRAFFDDVLDGLSRPQKQLPAKYFYDAAGSQLFDRITELDEYYLTRVERSIMRRHASEMAGCCGARCLLLEFGAGSLRKVRTLLNHLPQPAGYVPIDVSGSHLEHAASLLRQDYPQLRVLPVCADFTQDFPLPAVPNARRVVYFRARPLGTSTLPPRKD